MKKTWTTPKLTTHGSVEQLTQVNVQDVVKIGKFLLPRKGVNLVPGIYL